MHQYSRFSKYLFNKWAAIAVILICSVAWASWFPTLRVDGSTVLNTLNATGDVDLDSGLNVDGSVTMRGSAISAANYGHLAATDQDVATTDTPTFNGLETDDPVIWGEEATPSNPPAGQYKTYFKNDGNFYKLNSAGTEEQLGTGGGGSPGVAIGFAAERNSIQGGITTGADHKIQFDVETFDTDNYYDNATNYRFTPLTAGYYQVNLAIFATGTLNDGNRMICKLFKNGVRVYETYNTTGAPGQLNCTLGTVLFLNGSTDYIEGYIQHNRGSDASMCDGGTRTCYFTAHLVGQQTSAASLNYQISSDSGTWSFTEPTSFSYKDVPNLSVSITTQGRPVGLLLQPSSDYPTSSRFTVEQAGALGQATCIARYLRDGTTVVGGSHELRNDDAPGSSHGVGFSPAIFTIDFVPAGTYTYKFQIGPEQLNTTTCSGRNLKLIAFEF